MAYWFHRGVLKATAPVNFELKLIVLDSQALQLCSETRQARNKLLELLTDPNHEVSTIDAALEKYLSFFRGFIYSIDEPNGQSKLRHAIRFRWTQSCLSNTPISQEDAVFELISISQNVAIWLMKHSAMLAGKEEISMDEAKDVHNCLRKAAGIFTTMKDEYVGQLLQPPPADSDLDPTIVNAYINQCTAEAQEVTIARAIELKHAPSLISALANETSKLFTSAASSLTNCKLPKVVKWKIYLELKSVFYLSYSYCYAGENLLAQEKCGEAIRAVKESLKYFEGGKMLQLDYYETKAPGVSAKIHEHLFYRNLKPYIKRTLEKCERENGFIYHQKVPLEPPQLELKATYGLVSPVEFALPPLNKLWTPVVYAAFDAPKYGHSDPANSKPAKKDEGKLPPVKEVQVPQTSKDPKNTSGCNIQ